MATPQAQHSPYSMEEFARRGDERYEGDIRPRLGPGNDGKFVAIDIETGDYELAADELTAIDQLLARRPDAQIWLTRVGLGYTYRFGSHRQ